MLAGFVPNWMVRWLDLLILIVTVVLLILMNNEIQETRMNAFAAAIRREAQPGMTYDDYRTLLQKRFHFDSVGDWDEGEETPNGNLIRSIRWNFAFTWTRDCGPMNIAMIADGTFGADKKLRTVKVWRRGSGL